MKILIILLIIIIVILLLTILYYQTYSKFFTYKTKMDMANESIDTKLKEKYELMKSMQKLINKVLKKKEYLKDFDDINIKTLSLNDLSNALDDNLNTMVQLKEDHKSINAKEFEELLNKVNVIDEVIVANKKFFNKANNALLKEAKGYKKILAKIMKINTQSSYEIKEPMTNL